MIFHLSDYELVVADINSKEMTVYDCLENRALPDLQLLKKFICDYVDNYGASLWLTD